MSKKYIICSTLMLVFLIFISGFFIPQRFKIPVEGATFGSWDSNSFWYWPWGESIVHRGVDIFAEEGTNVLSSTVGIVTKVKFTANGGNTISILGPKWRIHYYAHLQSVSVKILQFVRYGEAIGKVGCTGNAINRPSHLHYSIETKIPYLWLKDSDLLGYEKMFYLNPIPYMEESLNKAK